MAVGTVVSQNAHDCVALGGIDDLTDAEQRLSGRNFEQTGKPVIRRGCVLSFLAGERLARSQSPIQERYSGQTSRLQKGTPLSEFPSLRKEAFPRYWTHRNHAPLRYPHDEAESNVIEHLSCIGRALAPSLIQITKHRLTIMFYSYIAIPNY